VRTSGTKGTRSTAGTPATAVTQAIAVMTAMVRASSTTGMKAWITNTTGTPSKSRDACKSSEAGTSCRDANYSRAPLTSGMKAAAGIVRTSWMSTAVGLPEQAVGKSATVEKRATFSRDASNSSRNSQQGQ